MSDRLDAAADDEQADQEPVDVPIRVAQQSAGIVEYRSADGGDEEGEEEREELGALEGAR